MPVAHAFAVPPATRFRKHEHDYPHICVLLGGGFLERDAGTWRDVGPGTVRVSGAARHDIDFSPVGARCLVIEGHLTGRSPDRARFIEQDASLIRIAAQIGETSGDRHPATRIRKDDLTTEFLAQLDRRLRGQQSPAPPWLERIREMVHDSGGSASVAELAMEAGVHRVHLARTFRDHYGMPVTTYARKVRVQAALTLLTSSSFPLSRLALESGFADQSHFNREIRAAVGMTPGMIRTSYSAASSDGSPASRARQ